VAVCGELGELANLIKKVERGDLTLDEARVMMGKECADVVTYLDILAARIGVSLGEVTVAKFNEVSVRVGSAVRLRADGSDYFIERVAQGEHSAVLQAAGFPAEGGGSEHGDVLRAAGIPGY
jgi:hypothetical protein